jgi:hypothetical protein
MTASLAIDGFDHATVSVGESTHAVGPAGTVP